MKQKRYFIYLMPVLFLAAVVVGCKPRIDTMAHTEKLFIKMVDKSAGKLDLNEDQKMKLEGLKNEIQKLEIEKQVTKKNPKKEKAIPRQLADLKEKAKTLESKWKTERELITKIKNFKKEIEDTKFESEKEQVKGDLQKVAEIKYGKIPNLLKEIQKKSDCVILACDINRVCVS